MNEQKQITAPEFEQDPVAYLVSNSSGRVVVEGKRQAENLASLYDDGTYTPLYASPQPKRDPLGSDDIYDIAKKYITYNHHSDVGGVSEYDIEALVRAIEKRMV
jgi:hypothetical protein